MSNRTKTPLLRSMRRTGATMYAFPSAAEDIGLNLSASAEGVALSRYALLNLTTSNFDLTDPDDVIRSLQNYAMNFETVLVNEPGYDFQDPLTVSERVFWRWLVKHGLELEEVPNVSGLYREKRWKSSDPDRMVQCLGSVDAGNSLSTEFGMFNETYVSVPTSWGNGPVFFRKASSDANYSRDAWYPTSGTAGQTIQGRGVRDLRYALGSGGLTPETDFGGRYRDPDAWELAMDLPSIQAALRAASGDETVTVGSYDDVNSDPDGLYASFAGTAADGYDMSSGCEFKFNVLALYYSVYDSSDVTKQPMATNLFGLVFLDGAASGSARYALEPLTKRKSYRGQSKTNAYFGNSYSFRVNLKTLSVYDDPDAPVEDSATSTSAYSQDFSDVVSNLNRAIDAVNSSVRSTAEIQSRYAALAAECDDARAEFAGLRKEVEAAVSDRLDAARKSSSDALADFRKEVLELLDERLGTGAAADATSDGTVQGSSVGRRPAARTVYGAAPAASSALGSPGASGRLSGSRVDVVSASDAAVRASGKISLTASDVDFNVTDSKNRGSISLLSLLSRIARAEDALASLSARVSELGYASVGTDSSGLSAAAPAKTAPAEDPSDAASAVLLAAGIVPVSGVLKYRSRKPSSDGYYLREDASGGVSEIAVLDGGEWTSRERCSEGRLYSVNGEIWSFDGEACAPVGSAKRSAK